MLLEADAPDGVDLAIAADLATEGCSVRPGNRQEAGLDREVLYTIQ